MVRGQHLSPSGSSDTQFGSLTEALVSMEHRAFGEADHQNLTDLGTGERLTRSNGILQWSYSVVPGW